MTVYRLIGCMTGTSCDGLDLAYIISNGADELTIGPAITIPFDGNYRNTLRQRVTLGVARHFMDDALAKDIANYHAHHIKEFMQHHQLEVDVIGFHGQTVCHDPANGITIQLGDCQHLANQLNIPVVGQMRLNDVANGGQGAPLVPIYHQAMAAKLVRPIPKVFQESCAARSSIEDRRGDDQRTDSLKSEGYTCFLNIGGVANITFIDEDNLIAGDVGPGNALLDDWMERHTGVAQDTNGECAKKGHVNQRILNKWLQDPFFILPLPKSLDRMYFHKFLDDCHELSVEDGAATLTSFTSTSILKCWEILPEPPKQVVVCGGGAHNPVLMAQLRSVISSELAKMDPRLRRDDKGESGDDSREHGDDNGKSGDDEKEIGETIICHSRLNSGHGTNVMTASDLGFNGDAIEAQLMAYLAARFFEKLPSSFSSTTGVTEPTIAGQLFTPVLD